MRSKKIGCIALAILLTFCAVSCKEEAGTSGDVPYDAPGNVKAIAFSGGIQLTWDPAINAQSYDVYRRTAGGKGADAESRFIGRISMSTGNADLNAMNRGGLTFNDVVSFSNQLVDKWEYVYTVVANGRDSLSGRSSVITIEADNYTMSVSAISNKVTANIPAQGSKLPTPVASMTRITQWSNTSGTVQDQFQVTYERTPGAAYQIGYGYAMHSGSPYQWAISAMIGSDAARNSGYFARYGTFNIPYVPTDLFKDGNGYGKRVEVRAVFPDNFYAPSDVAEVIYYDDNPRYDGPVTGFSASVQYAVPESYRDPSIRLTWQTSSTYTRSYELYRAEAISLVNIAGSWTQVTASHDRYTSGGLDYIRVTDFSIEAGKQYQYMLVATGYNGGKFAAVLSSLARVLSYSLPDPKEEFISHQTPAMTTAVEISSGTIPTVQRVKIEWTVPAAHSSDLTTAVYKLYRSVITTVDSKPIITNTGPSSNNIATASWGTPIAVLDMTDTANTSNVTGNTVFFYDTAIASMPTRVHYAYKLVVERKFDNQTVTKLDGGSYRIINQAPFVPYVNLSINPVFLNDLADIVFSINIGLAFTGYSADLEVTGFKIDILSKTFNDTAFTAIGPAVTGNALTSAFTRNYTIPISHGISNTSVVFKIETSFNGSPIHNIGNNEVTVNVPKHNITGQ